MKEEYNFEQFETSGSGYPYKGVSVNAKVLGVSKPIRQMFANDSVTRVDVSFDREKEAICLTETSDKNKGYSIKKSNLESSYISCPISRVMKQGRYEFIEKLENKYIFKKFRTCS